MKHVAGMLVLMALPTFAFTADNNVPPLTLDTVLFQMSTKQWVTTQTALLNVSISATLNSADLVKARSDIIDSLNKIAKGDWHIVSFNRSQDSSGLEKLDVQAQARIDQSELTDIYQSAKSVSMPGAKYYISGVDFKPSLEEVQAVKAQVRQKLYQQVNEEIARMNKVYPTQNYSVNNLTFFDGDSVIAQPRAYQAKEISNMAMASPSSSGGISVSNEIILTAVVEAASNRKQGN